MKAFLPLDQMTTEDTLLAMDQLWEDLSRTPEQVPSPAWHREILEDAQDHLIAG